MSFNDIISGTTAARLDHFIREICALIQSFQSRKVADLSDVFDIDLAEKTKIKKHPNAHQNFGLKFNKHKSPITRRIRHFR